MRNLPTACRPGLAVHSRLRSVAWTAPHVMLAGRRGQSPQRQPVLSACVCWNLPACRETGELHINEGERDPAIGDRELSVLLSSCAIFTACGTAAATADKSAGDGRCIAAAAVVAAPTLPPSLLARSPTPPLPTGEPSRRTPG